MYLTELLLEQPRRINPYDLHRKLWQLFDLPPGSERPFQYRVEHSKETVARILMQSSISTGQEIDHIKILRQKEVAIKFTKGQRLRFRLKANPIKTIKDEKGRKNSKGQVKSCRVPLIKEEEQIEWLTRKLSRTVSLSEAVIRNSENIYFRKGGRAGKVVAVTFDGMLCVEDDDAFSALISSGIGPAKSLGCGMLSLAPA